MTQLQQISRHLITYSATKSCTPNQTIHRQFMCQFKINLIAQYVYIWKTTGLMHTRLSLQHFSSYQTTNSCIFTITCTWAPLEWQHFHDHVSLSTCCVSKFSPSLVPEHLLHGQISTITCTWAPLEWPNFHHHLYLSTLCVAKFSPSLVPEHLLSGQISTITCTWAPPAWPTCGGHWSQHRGSCARSAAPCPRPRRGSRDWGCRGRPGQSPALTTGAHCRTGRWRCRCLPVPHSDSLPPATDTALHVYV